MAVSSIQSATRKERQKVTAKFVGGTPTSSEGAWYTNIALLSRAIASGSSDVEVKPPPILVQAETQRDKTAAQKKANGTESAMNAEIEAEDETKKAEVKEAIEKESKGDHMRQICFYQSGIGTSLNVASNLIEGGTGLGLVDKVQEGYSWIADNWTEGDEIFIFGFSRGAYTARCIAGFINWCGLIPKSFSGSIPLIFNAYQERDPKDSETDERAAKVLYKYTGKWPSADATATASIDSELRKADGLSVGEISDFKDQLSKLDKNEIKKMRDEKSSTLRMKFREPKVRPPPIRVVAVFDTVGALGVPGRFQDKDVENFFSFFDPGLAPNVDFAFHALSLLEDRQDFLPTIWYQPEGRQDERAKMGVGKQVLKQVWFPGSHSDIGGGWASHGLSDITLSWLVSQLLDSMDGPLLRIDLDVIKQCQDRRREWAQQPQHPSRGLMELKGTRQVCHRFDKKKEFNNVVWKNALKNGTSNESIHHSVVACRKYDPESSEQFKELKAENPALLQELWAEASAVDSLGRTEKLLKWKEADDVSSPTEQEEEENLARDYKAKSKQLLSLSAFAGGLVGTLQALTKIAVGPIVQIASDRRTLKDPNLKPGPLKNLNSRLRKLFNYGDEESRRKKDEDDGIIVA